MKEERRKKERKKEERRKKERKKKKEKKELTAREKKRRKKVFSPSPLSRSLARTLSPSLSLPPSLRSSKIPEVSPRGMVKGKKSEALFLWCVEMFSTLEEEGKWGTKKRGIP